MWVTELCGDNKVFQLINLTVVRKQLSSLLHSWCNYLDPQFIPNDYQRETETTNGLKNTDITVWKD